MRRPLQLLLLWLLLLSACTGSREGNAPCESLLDCEMDRVCAGGRCVSGTSPLPLAVVEASPSPAVGDVCNLSAARSVSVTGRPLRYLWTLSTPKGSQSRLRNRNLKTTSFQADLPGLYSLTLVVEDGLVSEPQRLEFNVRREPRPPLVAIGSDRDVLVASTVTLDSAKTRDPDGDPLRFQWRLLQTPKGASDKITNRERALASFRPDLPGIYIAEVTVSDGTFSRTKAVVLNAVTRAPAPIVDELSPKVLPLQTQCTLLLRGKHFLAGARVTLGKLEAQQVRRSNDTEIRAVFDLRGQTAGEREVVVTHPDGQRSEPRRVTLKTATLPALQSISPSWAFVQQSLSLTLTGNHFLPGARVFRGNTPLPTEVLSPTRLRVQFRAEKTGSDSLKVTNPDGQETPSLAVEVVGVAALLRELSTSRLTLGSSKTASLTLRGYNFVQGARVRLRSESTTRWAKQPLVVSTERMTATLPLAELTAGSWVVDVVNPASTPGNGLRLEILAP